MKHWNLGLFSILLTMSSSTDAALLERLGGLAYYDNEANITWLADANYAQTSGYDADGLMSWADANDWAADLNISGVTGWRLANTVDVGNDGRTYTNINQGVDFGYNITTHSELSNMFYNVLENTAFRDINGNPTGCDAEISCLVNTGPFSNIQTTRYWSSTELIRYDGRVSWYFNMFDGFQNYNYKSNEYYAWAVHSGDISAVPIPAAVWLFGSGLIGLAGFARRKKA